MALVPFIGTSRIPPARKQEKEMPRTRKLVALISSLALAPLCGPLHAATPTVPPAQHDGAFDFDFLIGDWKAHVRRLPDRLVGSNTWLEYDGISKHKKILDSNANFEEFEVDGHKPG